MMSLKDMGLLLLACAPLATSAAEPVGEGRYALGQDGQWRKKLGFNRGERTFFVSGLTADTGVEDFSVEAAYTRDGTNITIRPSKAMETYDPQGRITGYYKLFTEKDMAGVAAAMLTYTFSVTGRYASDKKKSADNEFELYTGEGHGDYPEEIPNGTSENNPLVISPSASAKYAECDSTNENFTGCFYLSADLMAGRKYMFGLECATNYPMSMYLKGTTNELFTAANDYSDVWTNCCAAYAVVPAQGGTYFIRVKSGRGKFRFGHEAVPDRKPGKHPHGEISTLDTDTRTFVPGYLNDPESGAFDDVIDQELFALSNYNKGDCLQFSAAFVNMGGKTANLLMRLYNSSGAVLGESRWAGNCETGRVVWAATSAGSSSNPLYVGVCRDPADGEPTSEAGEVWLRVRRVELHEQTTLVTAVPVSADLSPTDPAAGAEASCARTLGPLEWSNVFVLPVRAGITYRIKAKPADGGSASGYTLTATAYTLSGKTKKPLAVKDAAAIDPNAKGWLEILPDANATVYLEVSVADGPWGSGEGIAYGPYRLYATGRGSGDLGLLKATMGGAAESDMGWKIVSGPASAGIVSGKEPYYPAGSAVILPVGGAYAVAAKSISGFAKVDAKGYDVNVYVTGGGETDWAKEFRYFDTADPLDDGPDTKAKEPTTGRAYKPTKISPTSGKATEVCRSLWNAYEGQSYRDTVDWFTVSAKEGAYYRFSLPWTSDEKATKVQVYGPDDWTRECAYNVFTEPTNSVRIAAERKGTYYIRVANNRPDSSTNCAYKLRTLMMTPGTVRFSKNAITVKDTDTYVNITVNRTGKDGRIRVRYETVAGSAQPGTDFYPATDELIWENGDNKAKTVRVKLIPGIVASPTGLVKTFAVRFWTRTWEDPGLDSENEFIPSFDSKMGDTVAVAIAGSTTKGAGTVQAVCDNPKKPVFDVTAGETLEIPLERVVGTSGRVGVFAVTVSGTANRSGETDFEPVSVTDVWESGVGGRGAPVLVVRTKTVPGDYTAKKTFTVKLTALASGKGDAVQFVKPTLAASTITVNILNEKFARSVADWAKSKSFPPGVTGVKEGRSGTWFCVDDFGAELFCTDSKSAISFTLAGPGRFAYDAAGDGSVVTNWIRSGRQTLTLSGLERIRSYRYVQLPAVTMLPPLVDKATVRTGPVEFRFARGADDAADGIAYRVYALSAGTTGKIGDAATEVRPADGAYVTNVWYDAVNKGKWTFRADSFFVGGPVTNAPRNAWSFAVADESSLPPGATLAVTPVRGSDAYGNPLDIVGGDRVILHRLVKANFAVGAPGSKVSKVTGAIPPGLSLKSVKQADGLAQFFLVGTPKKAGEYLVVLQEASGAGKGATTALAITVEDSGRPEGTFNGLAAVDSDDAVGQFRQSVAKVSFTAASSGKLSAKALIGGKTYSFADTGYARVRTNEAGRATLEAVLTQAQTVKQNGVQTVFVNELGLAVLEGETGDASLWTLSEPSLRLTMRALPDLQGEGFTRDVDYFGTLVRDNTKTKEWVSAAAGFSGYYTVALVPDTNALVSVQKERPPDNYPNGNGYLTVTVDAKGKAKCGGALADGASFSASMPIALGVTNGEAVVELPLYVAKNKSVLAGWAGIRFPGGRAPKEPITGSWTDDVPIVQAFGDEGVVWFNDDSNATYDGKFGYGIGIHPVGGWYDTVINLQRHYLGDDHDHTFSVDTATVDELWQISELIHGNVGGDCDLAPGIALPRGQSVDLAVNNLLVDKQYLAKDSTKTYYVWDKCVNPANVKLTFKRATGVLTGTCCIWYEKLDAKGGVLLQKNYSNCRHAGVFLMCRDADDLLPDNVVTAGALVIPQTIGLPNGARRTWNANFRFNVISARRPMDRTGKLEEN